MRRFGLKDRNTIDKKYNTATDLYNEYNKHEESMKKDEHKKRTRNIGFFSNKLKNSSKK